MHGCLDELLDLEALVARWCTRRGRTPLVVLVGDLVDRGPASRGVVDHVSAGCALGTHAAVMGNHEEMFLRVLSDVRPDLVSGAAPAMPAWIESGEEMVRRRPKVAGLGSLDEWSTFQRLSWLTQGGAETLRSYGADPARPATWNIPPEHIRFLAALPLHWEDDHAVVTHALATRDDLEGLRSGDSTSRMLAMRVLWSRELPRDRPDPLRTHASGHTPLQRVRRHASLRLIRLDTGAFGGRRLSAWCTETGHTLSVSSRTQWTPP